MTRPTPIRGLNASVIEAAERNRLAGYLNQLKSGKAFSNVEDADFRRLFERYREDAPPDANVANAEQRFAESEQFLSVEKRVLALIEVGLANSSRAKRPKGAAKGKPTRELTALMEEVVLQKLLRGVSYNGIVGFGMQRWGYTDAGMGQMIKRARMKLAEVGQKRRRELRATSSFRLDEAFLVASNAGDPSAMVRAVEAFNRLHGLNAAAKTEITGLPASFVPAAAGAQAAVELPPEG